MSAETVRTVTLSLLLQDPHHVAWTDSLGKHRITQWKSQQVSLEEGPWSLLGRLADSGPQAA